MNEMLTCCIPVGVKVQRSLEKNDRDWLDLPLYQKCDINSHDKYT